MANSDFLGEEKLIYPFKFLGITDSFTAIDLYTLINTWFVLLALFVFALIGRYFISQRDSVLAFLVKKFVSNFYNLVQQTFGRFDSRYYMFIASLFLFILFCNWISLIPCLEEPTKNINTTVALGITAFLFMHKQMIRVHGIKEYLKEMFMPLNIMFPFNLIAGLAMLPLKLLGEVAGVISVSFRLFGNIFGGFVISSIFHHAISGSIIWNLLGMLLGISLIIQAFFIIFEGFLQAFVFSILTLTNIAMAVGIQENKANEIENIGK